jgi:hypothetical protein
MLLIENMPTRSRHIPGPTNRKKLNTCPGGVSIWRPEGIVSDPATIVQINPKIVRAIAPPIVIGLVGVDDVGTYGGTYLGGTWNGR